MKKMIIGGLVAGGLMLGAAGLVLGAGLAQWKPRRPQRACLRDGAARGRDGRHRHPGAEGVALMVCEKRGQGLSEDAVIAQTETMRGMSAHMADDVVLGAEYHFCPQYSTGENDIDDIMRGHYRVAP